MEAVIRMRAGKPIGPKRPKGGAHGGKRPAQGSKRRLKASDVAVVGSIRLTPAQWKLFNTWGGVERLRKHLNAVKGGVNKSA